jgi:hypothetical protein
MPAVTSEHPLGAIHYVVSVANAAQGERLGLSGDFSVLVLQGWL